MAPGRASGTTASHPAGPCGTVKTSKSLNLSQADIPTNAMAQEHRPLRIGFLTAKDPTDQRSWSGIMYFLSTSLAKHCGDVVPLGPVTSLRQKRLRDWRGKARAVFGKRYDVSHSLYLSADFAKTFAAKLARTSVDVIFAPSASTEIAFLKTRVPIVYLSDSTFAAISGYYEDFSDLFALSRFEANFIERRAIRKASRIIYASQWAKASAIRDYGAEGSKITVIPFGANLNDAPEAASVWMRKRTDHLRLLFVGVDWHRKGGPIAVETLIELTRLGVPATLTVVGCTPPASVQHPNLRVVPFLNKNDPLQRKQMVDLYLNSDAFVLPTRAECAGVVFSEAAAFGLPVFSTDTGGVPSVVANGVTGLLFALEAEGSAYASTIAALWRDEPRFAAMVTAARRAFETRLNWDSWGQTAAEVIRAARTAPV